ncbi:hypothetical protein ABTL25_20265, partial [Acinetobacter baumannii]
MGDCKVEDRPLDMADLVSAMEKGCKPRADWRIGAEHEKFGFRHGSLDPIPYDGADGVEALLKGLMRFGWSPVTEA